MNIRRLLAGSLLFTLILSAQANTKEQNLAKEAKISKTQSEHIALSKVPHGRIKSAEIENENGHLVWSFDIAEPKSKDITEILVDAKTGRIVAKQTESPADQAKEAAADRQNH